MARHRWHLTSRNMVAVQEPRDPVLDTLPQEVAPCTNLVVAVPDKLSHMSVEDKPVERYRTQNCPEIGGDLGTVLAGILEKPLHMAVGVERKIHSDA